MIKIYQIQLTKEQVNAVNNDESVPAFEAKMQAQMGFKTPTSLEHFVKAYEVHTDDKDLAFEYTNLWNNQYFVEAFGDRNHSTSVGDIFEMDNGDFYMVANFGFEKLNMMQQAA
tara:strand:- start:1661 stop:2002 length:342 start_codon:yes stop_codon:yes gene_type:complete